MSIARNSALNVAGSVIPLIVAFPAMAVMARALGVERFGLVLLAWALVGYAGILDLGLSRAVVRSIAALGTSRDDHSRALSTAALTVFALAMAGAAAIIVLGHPLAMRMGVDPSYSEDVKAGLVLVALSLVTLLPTLVLQAYWDGVQDFVEANKQRALGGAAVPAFSAAAVAWEPSFFSAMAGLAAARLFTLVFAMTRGDLHRLLRRQAVSVRELRGLLSFGGGIAVSNVVSPLMGYMDRFILAFAQGPIAVGPYAAAADVAIKLLVLPVAVTRSLFPRLVGHAPDSAKAYRDSAMLIALLCLPVAAVLFLAAGPLMALWLGQEFVDNGAARALQILMLGFLLSAIAQLPYTRLHGGGHSNITAAIHLAEVLPFVSLCYLLCSRYGVEGAAWAWTLRNGADLMLLAAADRWTRRKT